MKNKLEHAMLKKSVNDFCVHLKKSTYILFFYIIT